MNLSATAKCGTLAMALAWGVGMVIGDEPVSIQKDAPSRLAPATAEGAEEPAKDLWLGIFVSKPDPAVHAQLKDIPKGVGFVVDRIAKQGPAGRAGLQAYDFVWKMDEQLLVNSGQFWTLLNLREAGDEVTLTVQRGGENLVLKVVAEQRPEDQKGRESADAQVLAPPLPGMPRLIVDHLGRVAELRDAKGSVRIWREKEGFGWAEYDRFDLEMRSGSLAGTGEEALPPDMEAGLRTKLEALLRGFEQAERNHRANGRAPRVRRVPVSGNATPSGGSVAE
jgi:hypothetical protein